MIGDNLITKDGFNCRIIDEKKCIRFYKSKDGKAGSCSYIQNTLAGDPYLLVQGFGYVEANDLEEYLKLKKSQSYKAYVSMLYRCFNNPVYKNASVSDEWRCFNHFKKWFDENYIPGFVMDKDLFSDPGNKIYSPETCCFIPKWVNCTIKANPEKIQFDGWKYFYMDESNFYNPKRVSFKTREEAVNSRRKYLRLRMNTAANIFREQLDKRVYQKLISLYEK